MAVHWEEPGEHSKVVKADYAIADEWIESSMGTLDQNLATYGFDTLPENATSKSDHDLAVSVSTLRSKATKSRI